MPTAGPRVAQASRLRIREASHPAHWRRDAVKTRSETPCTTPKERPGIAPRPRCVRKLDDYCKVSSSLWVAGTLRHAGLACTVETE